MRPGLTPERATSRFRVGRSDRLCGCGNTAQGLAKRIASPLLFQRNASGWHSRSVRHDSRARASRRVGVTRGCSTPASTADLPQFAARAGNRQEQQGGATLTTSTIAAAVPELSQAPTGHVTESSPETETPAGSLAHCYGFEAELCYHSAGPLQRGVGANTLLVGW